MNRLKFGPYFNLQSPISGSSRFPFEQGINYNFLWVTLAQENHLRLSASTAIFSG